MNRRNFGKLISVALISISLTTYLFSETLADILRGEPEPAKIISLSAPEPCPRSSIETWVVCGCGAIVGCASSPDGYIIQCLECNVVHKGDEYHERQYFGETGSALYCQPTGELLLRGMVIYSLMPSNWIIEKCKYCGFRIETSGWRGEGERIVQFKEKHDD